MKRRESRARSWLALLLAFTILLQNTPVSAQSGLQAVLAPPDLSQFPNMVTFVDVYDSQGAFVGNLNTDQFTLEENGEERPINEASRVEPGLHTILALNLGPTLSNRIIPETTRFEDVIFLTTNWMDTLQSEAPNLYSFTSNERAWVQRTASTEEMIQTLQNYKPNLFNFEPDQQSLSFALDVAAQETQNSEHAKQTIFYITPLPLESEIDQIPILAARAQEIGVPVNVWLVAKETSSNAPAADALRDLASATGGKFFLYNEKVEPPNPETLLQPLRYSYRIRYTSAINQSGFHRIKLTVDRGVQRAETDDVAFQIELLPPEVTIIALPPQIQRVWVDPEEGSGQVLKPDFITLQISVSFPDGYPRQLKYSRLIVDGEEVILLEEAPFEWLGWSLEGYTTNSIHGLLVEVEDILGFRSLSSSRQVEIRAEQRYRGAFGSFVNFFQSGGWTLFAGLFAVAGFWMYVIYRRRNPRYVSTSGQVETEIFSGEDPLTQQVLGTVEPVRIAKPKQTTKLVARLEILDPTLQDAFAITKTFTTIGSNAEEVDISISHPSISTLHARIQRSSKGNMILADMGSESGTRVNYAPVSRKGTVLRNNDLIHIGEVALRFYLVSAKE